MSSRIVERLERLLQIVREHELQDEELIRLLVQAELIGSPIIIQQIDEEKLRVLEQRLEVIDSRIAECCQVAKRDSELLHHLIAPIGAYRESIKYIDTWLKDAETLIVTDPYFYQYDKGTYRTHTEYSETLTSILPRKLGKLDVFHLPGPHGHIKNKVEKYCRDHGIKLRNYPTNEIHDRVWIKNSNSAKVVGTSFGGIGNKLAFILDLPVQDLQSFKVELHRIRVSLRP